MNWRDTVNNTKTQNPGLPFKDVLRKSSEAYRAPKVTPKAEAKAERPVKGAKNNKIDPPVCNTGKGGLHG